MLVSTHDEEEFSDRLAEVGAVAYLSKSRFGTDSLARVWNAAAGGRSNGATPARHRRVRGGGFDGGGSTGRLRTSRRSPCCSADSTVPPTASTRSRTPAQAGCGRGWPATSIRSRPWLDRQHRPTSAAEVSKAVDGDEVRRRGERLGELVHRTVGLELRCRSPLRYRGTDRGGEAAAGQHRRIDLAGERAELVQSGVDRGPSLCQRLGGVVWVLGQHPADPAHLLLQPAQVHQDVALNGRREPVPFGVADPDQSAPRLRQRGGVRVERLSPGREFGLQPGVVERRPGLLGEGGEQPPLLGVQPGGPRQHLQPSDVLLYPA